MEKKIIIYDFDGTLTPYPMPKFEILKKCGIENYATNSMLKSAVKQKMEEEHINSCEAIYNLYFETIKNAGYELKNENFSLGAESVEYNPGVIKFLSHLNENGIDNYIVSSGIKPYLEHVKIVTEKLINDIYATEFCYDENNIVNGIKYLMTDVRKVEAIKDIIKNSDLKDCSNVIYVGDGLTDYYAFEYVHNNGGKAIYLYQNDKDTNIDIMRKKGIIDLFCKPDYTLESKLSEYIKKECNI